MDIQPEIMNRKIEEANKIQEQVAQTQNTSEQLNVQA